MMKNMVISAMNAIVTAITMILGKFIAENFDPDISSTIGATIFLTLGALDLYTVLVARCSSPSITKTAGEDVENQEGRDMTNKDISVQQVTEDGAVGTITDTTSAPQYIDSPSSPQSANSAEDLLRPKMMNVSWRETLIVGIGLCVTNIGGGSVS